MLGTVLGIQEDTEIRKMHHHPLLELSIKLETKVTHTSMIQDSTLS